MTVRMFPSSEWDVISALMTFVSVSLCNLNPEEVLVSGKDWTRISILQLNLDKAVAFDLLAQKITAQAVLFCMGVSFPKRVCCGLMRLKTWPCFTSFVWFTSYAFKCDRDNLDYSDLCPLPLYSGIKLPQSWKHGSYDMYNVKGLPICWGKCMKCENGMWEKEFNIFPTSMQFIQSFQCLKWYMPP